MKVHIVGRYDYDDYNIVDVFANEDHAKALLAVYGENSEYGIDSYNVNEEDVSDRVVWCVVKNRLWLGNQTHAYVHDVDGEESGPVGDLGHTKVYVFAKSEAEALEKGLPLIAKFREDLEFSDLPEGYRESTNLPTD